MLNALGDPIDGEPLPVRTLPKRINALGDPIDEDTSTPVLNSLGDPVVSDELPSSPATPPSGAGLLRTARDVGSAVEKGFANIVTTGGQLASMAGRGLGIEGVRKAGEATREYGQGLEDWWGGTMAPENANPEGIGKKILFTTAESAPSMIGAVIPAAGASIALKGAGMAAKAAKYGKLGKFLIKQAPVIAGSAAEGIQAFGQNAAQERDTINKMADADLVNLPKFQEAVDKTNPDLPMPERIKQARESITQAAERNMLATIGWTGGISMLTGAGAIGQILDKPLKIGVTPLRNILKNTWQGMSRESIQEFFQSGGEYFIQEMAANRSYNPERVPTAGGVAESALLGAASGAILGGVGGAGKGVSVNSDYNKVLSSGIDKKTAAALVESGNYGKVEDIANQYFVARLLGMHPVQAVAYVTSEDADQAKAILDQHMNDIDLLERKVVFDKALEGGLTREQAASIAQGKDASGELNRALGIKADEVGQEMARRRAEELHYLLNASEEGPIASGDGATKGMAFANQTVSRLVPHTPNQGTPRGTARVGAVAGEGGLSIDEQRAQGLIELQRQSEVLLDPNLPANLELLVQDEMRNGTSRFLAQKKVAAMFPVHNPARPMEKSRRERLIEIRKAANPNFLVPNVLQTNPETGMQEGVLTSTQVADPVPEPNTAGKPIPDAVSQLAKDAGLIIQGVKPSIIPQAGSAVQPDQTPAQAVEGQPAGQPAQVPANLSPTGQSQLLTNKEADAPSGLAAPSPSPAPSLVTPPAVTPSGTSERAGGSPLVEIEKKRKGGVAATVKEVGQIESQPPDDSGTAKYAPAEAARPNEGGPSGRMGLGGGEQGRGVARLSPKRKLPRVQKASEIKEGEMGRGWFIMPDGSLIDVTSDFGGGTNDHVGIFVIADNPSEFGITRKEALSTLDELNETGDPTGLMELWKRVYDMGIIRVRQFEDALAINSMNPIPLAYIQRLMNLGKIPTAGVKSVSVEGLMGAPGGDVYNVPIDEFRNADRAKDIAPVIGDARFSLKQGDELRGEWWIADGSPTFADGDMGEMGHEQHAIQNVTEQILEELDIESNGDSILLSDYQSEIDDIIGDQDLVSWLQENASDDVAKNAKEMVDVANGNSDARAYMAESHRWKRVAGNTVETHTFSDDDLSDIQSGLGEILSEEGINGDPEFDIYVAANQKWFRGVPYSAMSKGVAGLREYDASYEVRLSPKQTYSPPTDAKLRPYFTRGKNAPNEQTAKTQAGMIRKQNLPAANAMLDGFYSAHPAVTPKFPEWYTPPALAPSVEAPAPAPVASSGATVPPTARPRIDAKQYTKQAVADLTRSMKELAAVMQAINSGKQVAIPSMPDLNSNMGDVETTDKDVGIPEFPAEKPLPQEKRFIVPLPSTTAEKKAKTWKEFHARIIDLAKGLVTFQGGKGSLTEPVAWQIKHLWTDAQRKAVTVINDYFGGGGGWGVFMARDRNFDNAKEVNVYEYNPDRMLKIKFLYEQGRAFHDLYVTSGLRDMFNSIEADMLRLSGDNVTSMSAMSNRLDAIKDKNPGKVSNETWRGMVQYLVDYGVASFATKKEGGKDVAPQAAIRLLDDQANNIFNAVQELKSRGVKVNIRQADSYSLTPVSGKHVLSVFDPPYYNTAGYNLDGSKSRVEIDLYRKNVAMLDRLVAADNNIIYTDETWWTENKSDKKSASEQAKQEAERPEALELLGRVQKQFDHLDIWKVGKRYETIGMRNAMEEKWQMARLSPKRSSKIDLSESRPNRIDISGIPKVRRVINSMTTEDKEGENLDALKSIPESIAVMIKHFDIDDFSLRQLSYYGKGVGMYKATNLGKVAPESYVLMYRPAVVFKDGKIAYNGMIHAYAIAQYNIDHATNYQNSDVLTTGAIGPDGKFYDQGLFADISDSDIKDAAKDLRRLRYSPKTIAPAFYSQLRKVISDKMPNRATVQQVRNMIDPQKGSGVKADELKWSGLQDFLDSKKPLEMVTKDEVMAAARDVELKEVALGEGRPLEWKESGTAVLKARDADNNEFRIVGAEVDGMWRVLMNGKDISDDTSDDRPFATIELAKDAAERLAVTEGDNDTKFSQYTEPGSDEGSYREYVITMPPDEQGGDRLASMKQQVKASLNLTTSEMRSVDAAQSVDELLNRIAPEFRAPFERNIIGAADFRSNHFQDIPGYLYHFRTNVRTVKKDGFVVVNVKSGRQGPFFQTRGEAEVYQKTLPTIYKTEIRTTQKDSKVFFVEEIQSDRAQKARELRDEEVMRVAKEIAHKRIGPTAAEIIPTDADLAEASKQVPKDFGFAATIVPRKVTGSDLEVRQNSNGFALYDKVTGVNIDGSYDTREQADERLQQWLSTGEAWDISVDALMDKQRGKIPQMPFADTSSGWSRQAMKRIIRLAAEQGADMVSWTPGRMQVDRYNEAMRQNVDRIEVDAVSQWKRGIPYKNSNGSFVFKLADGTESAGAETRPIAVMQMDEYEKTLKPNHVSIVASKGGNEVFRAVVPLEGRTQIHGHDAGLADVIGKSLAEKVRANPTQKHDFTGPDLAIGGEGMMAFYDRMLVNIANDIGKKWGAKVEMVNMGGDKRSERDMLDRLMDEDPPREVADADEYLQSLARVRGAMNEGQTFSQAVESERKYGDSDNANSIEDAVLQRMPAGGQPDPATLDPSVPRDPRPRMRDKIFDRFEAAGDGSGILGVHADGKKVRVSGVYMTESSANVRDALIEKYNQLLAKWRNSAQSNMIPSLPITDAMKDSALYQGFPRFAQKRQHRYQIVERKGAEYPFKVMVGSRQVYEAKTREWAEKRAESAIADEIRNDDSLFADWDDSETKDGVIVGYRGGEVYEGKYDVDGISGTEGNGVYIARDKSMADMWGESEPVEFRAPKNPLKVINEPLYILAEDDALMEPPSDTDSEWLAINKEAVRRSGITDDTWSMYLSKLNDELTNVMKERGHDAVYIDSGDVFIVILDNSLLNTKRGIRSAGGIGNERTGQNEGTRQGKGLAKFSKTSAGRGEGMGGAGRQISANNGAEGGQAANRGSRASGVGSGAGRDALLGQDVLPSGREVSPVAGNEGSSGQALRVAPSIDEISRDVRRVVPSAVIEPDPAWENSPRFKAFSAITNALGVRAIAVSCNIGNGAFLPKHGVIILDHEATIGTVLHELYHARYANNDTDAVALAGMIDPVKVKSETAKKTYTTDLSQEYDDYVSEEGAGYAIEGLLSLDAILRDGVTAEDALSLMEKIKKDRSPVVYASGSAAMSPKSGNSPDVLRKAVLEYAGRLGDKMTGTKAWLTPTGKWINVEDHVEAIPYSVVSIDTGVPDMTKAGFVRVAWERNMRGMGGMLHAEYDRSTITPMQRTELKNTAVDKGGEVAYDPVYAKFSSKIGGVTPEQDAAYLAAVKRGDMAEAQRMVDEAVERAMAMSKVRDQVTGRLIPLQHETDKSFNQFKPGGKNPSASGPAIWMGKWGDAGRAAHNTYPEKSGYRKMKLYAGMRNPLVLDTDAMLEWARSVFARESSKSMQRDFPLLLDALTVRRIHDEGYDGIMYWDRPIASTYANPLPKELNEIIAFDPNLIKSADPVTYDDNGKVIPLSERFNEKSNDIRLSPKQKSQVDQLRAMVSSYSAQMESMRQSGTEIPAETQAAFDAIKTQLSEMGSREATKAAARAAIPSIMSNANKAIATLADNSAEADEARQALTDALSDEEAGNEARRVAEGRMRLRDAIARLSVLTARGERNALRGIKVEIGRILKARLPLDERGKFIHRVAVAASQKDLEEVAIAIDYDADKYQKRQLVKLIKKVSEKAVDSPSVAVDYKNKIEALLDGVLLTTPTQATIDKVQATKEFIEAELIAGRDVEVPRLILDKLRILTAKPASEMSVSELEDIVGTLSLLAKQGKTKLAAMKAIDAAQKESDAAALKAQGTHQINSADIERPPLGELPSWGMKMRNLMKESRDNLRKYYMWHVPTDVMADITDGNKHYQGIAYAIYKGRPSQAFALFRKSMYPVEQEFHDIIKKHNIGEKESLRVGIYAVAKQKMAGRNDYGRTKLYSTFGATTDEQKAEMDKQIDAIVLTPDEQAYYDFMRKKMDEVRPLLAKAAKDVYNANLDEVSDYFPMQTDWDLQENDILDGWTLDKDHQMVKKEVEHGMLKKRTGAGRQKVRVDSAKVFVKHMNDAHYMINMAPVTKYLSEFTRRDDVKEMLGDEGQRYWLNYIDTLARRGGVGGDHQIRWVDALRRNVGIGTLGFRLSSILIQPSSFIDAMGTVGPRWGLKGATNIMTDSKWRKFVFDNMQEVRDRVGDDPSYAESGALKWLNTATKYGYLPLEKLDRYTAAAVGAAAYEKYMHDHGLEVDLDNPNPEAIANAELMVRRTQASGVFFHTPQTVSRGEGWNSKTLAKAIYQFQTFTMNKFSYMAHDAIGYGASDREWGKAFMMLLWAMVAYLAEETIRAELKVALGGQRKKTDSVLDEAMLDFVTAVPLLGPIINSTRYGSVPVPVVSTAMDLQKAGKSLVSAKTPEAKGRAAISAAGAVGTLSGIAGSGQVSQFFRRKVTSDKEDTSRLINDSAKRLPSTASAGRVALEAQRAYNMARSRGLLDRKTTASEFRSRYKSAFKRINSDQ